VDYKQVIIIRKDLRMGTGKLAAQVAHAAVMAAEKARYQNSDWLQMWLETGQAKVVLKVYSLEELIKLRKHAEILHLIVVQIHDSGLTQIPPGTITCIGIGPSPSYLVDMVTRGLKLL
jgi:PTH2 family peptidyl-tRNA hydrolase